MPKQIRVMVTDEMQRAIEVDAAKRGETQSEWWRAAGEARLPADVRRKLPEMRGVGQPRKER